MENGTRRDANDFILQDVTQRVDRVHANVRNRTATSDVWIIDPGPAMIRSSHERELGAGKGGGADLSPGHALAQPADTFFEAEHVGHTQQNLRLARRFDHAAAFFGAHAHGLFAQYRLAGGDRCQHIIQMRAVGSSDQYCIHLGRAAQLRGRGENVTNMVTLRGLVRFGLIAPGKRSHLAVLGQGEAWHQAANGVKSEANNSESNHTYRNLLIES